MLLPLEASRRRHFRRGPFEIYRVQPGRARPESADTGLAGLGCFDHAHLREGLIVPMHQHRDDEIVSYLRTGEMIHEDSTGEQAALSPTHWMAMNAGRGMWHEERVPAGEVHMLQIFVRPETEALDPQLQFARLESAVSSQWRPIFSPPGGGAPLTVRQQAWAFDARMDSRTNLDLPALEPQLECFLYLIAGEAWLDGHPMKGGDGVLISHRNDAHSLYSPAGPTDLILFAVDPRARFSRAGTLSG
jgi:redox-sensitive bicupin YhaK (pirin superfamily)